MKIDVKYMSGAGNLFTIIDNEEYHFDINTLKSLAPLLCGKNQYNDFISEGLIAVQKSDKYNFLVEFINPDGSHGAMCGNGGRCAVDFANQLNLVSNNETILFQMAGNTYKAAINSDGTIALTFPPPERIDLNINIAINDTKIIADYIDVGTDHALINFREFFPNEKFREFDIDKPGKEIRFHKIFNPHGVNVNFYVTDTDSVQVRTYERGVEAETGACGTGAIATALICNLKHGVKFPVTIIPPSRQPLIVDCIFQNNVIKSIILNGPSETLDNKIIEIPDKFFEVQND
jgi:diaminopimelate epimerase